MHRGLSRGFVLPETDQPVIEEVYQRVRDGKETQIAIDANSREDYREQLERELKEIDESELWTAGPAGRWPSSWRTSNPCPARC